MSEPTMAEMFPECAAEERDTILWCLTAFPACDKEILKTQLADIRAKLDAGIGMPQQMKDADAAMDEAMGRRKEDEQ